MSDRPLRILQILRAPVGGLFRHVSDLTRALSARGHQIGLVVDSLRSDGLTEQRLKELEPFIAFGIHSMPIPRVLGGSDITTPRKIRKLARELGVEVLHGHGAKGGFHARLARIGTECVTLYTPHGGVLNYKTGSPSGIGFRLIEQTLLPLTNAVIFESAFAQQAYYKQIGEPDVPNPVIHNGLAPSEFEPIPLTADARDFVFIGEFREVKGIEYLLDALVEVKAPDGRPATIIMAGDGPLRGPMEAKVVELGMTDRVTMPGAQPARAMLAQGRCLVVPSIAESLPYVVLEGASAARPVIATNVGGISEIFGPTKARLIPSGDVDALRAAMQGVMDDPDAADREMRIRLDYVRENFSLELMASRIEALYRQVLARP
jgi:glycosyltransferase involved in cell wall biosynthesis